jgi:geranylgeranyl diphosphate synthase, type II
MRSPTAGGAERPPRRHRGRLHGGTRGFEQSLARYRDLTTRALLDLIPEGGPPYLYDLVSVYPRRLGKGLRGALCLAACEALGGSERQALNSAVATELFHNAFLIHDDVQDESLARRGAATLHREHGVGIAVNVGNAANLLALRRVLENRRILGPERSGLVVEETERMMRHSLEGQAIELGWIRDNVCDLEPRDYLQMCLKKTAWYSFLYPLRVGAIVAEGAQEADRFGRFGWYLGAAFQIQDDILNLTGDYRNYRKEIGGDLREGKRTLMLIRLLSVCTPKERRALERYLASPRAERTPVEMEWVSRLMVRYETIAFARRSARQLAGAALVEALTAFRRVPDSNAKLFILNTVLYVVSRDR